MMRRLRARDGFTLIEVMVAALLLLIVMAGFLPVFLQGLNQSTMVRYKSLATNIARERMEQVRQLDYQEIPEGSTLDTESVGNVLFTIEQTATRRAYNTGELMEVSVRVWWTAPPKVSEAFITSLINKETHTPKGYLEFDPLGTDDPLLTPFKVLNLTETVKYHIVEPDWSLLYDNLNQPDEAPRAGVYMRLTFVGDSGSSVSVGPDDDKKIDNLVRFPGTGEATDIYFQYGPFDTTQIPDGYWQAQAIAYNQYGEPGPMWTQRVRIENGPPAAVTDLIAQGQDTNEDVVLTWTPGGPERDRAYWEIERRKNNPLGGWLGWLTVTNDLDPTALTYTDEGDARNNQEEDPWGNGVTTNSYQYRVRAVDIAIPGNFGEYSNIAETYLPVSTTPTSSTTTSSTTTTSTTTSIPPTTSWPVRLSNSTNKTYSVTIRDSASATVWSGSLGSGSIQNPTVVTTTAFPAGSYSITATSPGRPTLTPTFELSAPGGQIVLDI